MSSPPEYGDLGRLDRDVAAACAALSAWQRALERDPIEVEHTDPLVSYRHIAGRTAYLAIKGDDASRSADAPLREGLARFVAWFTLARLGREADVNLALATHEKSARYTLGVAREVSLAEAVRALVSVDTEAEADAWLHAAAERGPEVAAARRERASLRQEVATRLGLAGPHVLVTREDPAALAVSADAFFAKSRLLWRDELKRLRGAEAARAMSPLVALRAAMARDAREGWPAQRLERWLLDLFPAVAAGLKLRLDELPHPLGAASFARALFVFGKALRSAGRSRSVPFAVGAAPGFADAYRYGAVFASLGASRAFQKHLGNSTAVAAAQARSLSVSLLFSARFDAARALLDRDPTRFEEVTSDLFGVPLPISLAGAWPAAHDDEPARTLALVTTRALAVELVERFDVDWFLNPRAVAFLRARASGPAWEDTPAALDGAGASLAAGFEEALA